MSKTFFILNSFANKVAIYVFFQVKLKSCSCKTFNKFKVCLLTQQKYSFTKDPNSNSHAKNENNKNPFLPHSRDHDRSCHLGERSLINNIKMELKMCDAWKWSLQLPWWWGGRCWSPCPGRATPQKRAQACQRRASLCVQWPPRKWGAGRGGWQAP